MNPERDRAPAATGALISTTLTQRDFDHRSDERAVGAGRSHAQVLSLVPKVPFEPEAELSMIAELAEPLHGRAALAAVQSDDFYDHRHRRIAAALIDGHSPEPGDLAYVQHATRFAFPLTAQRRSAFADAARKRARLLELERERLDLLGVVA